MINLHHVNNKPFPVLSVGVLPDEYDVNVAIEHIFDRPNARETVGRISTAFSKAMEHAYPPAFLLLGEEEYRDLIWYEHAQYGGVNLPEEFFSTRILVTNGHALEFLLGSPSDTLSKIFWDNKAPKQDAD